MFDNIQSLVLVAAYEVQRQLAGEAMSRGETYKPRPRPSLTPNTVNEAFTLARAEYQMDKKLTKYAPRPDDEVQDRFKRMLSAICWKILKKHNGFDPSEDDVRVMRHLLGHIFAWRRNGKFSSSALEIATNMKLVAGE